MIFLASLLFSQTFASPVNIVNPVACLFAISSGLCGSSTAFSPTTFSTSPARLSSSALSAVPSFGNSEEEHLDRPSPCGGQRGHGPRPVQRALQPDCIALGQGARVDGPAPLDCLCDPVWTEERSTGCERLPFENEYQGPTVTRNGGEGRWRKHKPLPELPRGGAHLV